MPQSIHPRFRIRDLTHALCLMALGAIALLVAILAPTGINYQYGIVLPMWQDLGDSLAIISKANGEIISINDKTRIALVYSDDDNFVANAYQAGAWLVFEPLELGGCISFGESIGA